MAASQKSSKKSAKKGSTVSKKVGLIFPVGRVRSMLKKGRYTKRVGAAAPVYLTAVLEYLTAELLELSGKVAAQHKKKRVTPRAVTLAVRHDDELSQLLGNVTFTQGGVAPQLHEALRKKSKGKSSSQQV